MIHMKRWILHSLVYTDLFISLCAAAMAWEAGFIVGKPLDPRILGLIFMATLCSYTFHSLVNLVYPAESERRHWNVRHRYLLVGLFTLALILLIAQVTPFLHHLLPLSLAAFFTFLYSAPNLPGKIPYWLRKLAFGKTAYLALMWAYSTTLLPLWLNGNHTTPTVWLFFAYRFFLIYAICILFDRRDIEEDKRKGIKALPTVLSENKVKALYFTSLMLSSIFCLWNDVFLLILLLPIFILIPFFRITKGKNSDWIFYVLLDGLMALTAFLHASLFG